MLVCWSRSWAVLKRDEVEVNKSAKTRTGQSPAILTEHAWSIKPGFIVWPKQSLFLRAKREISSGREGPILPARVANQNAAFAHSLARLWNQLLPIRSLLGSIFWLSTKVISHFPLDCLRVTSSIHSTNKLPLCGPVLVDFTTSMINLAVINAWFLKICKLYLRFH